MTNPLGFFRPNFWSISINRMAQLLKEPKKVFLLGDLIYINSILRLNQTCINRKNEYITRFIMIRNVKIEIVRA